MSLRLALARLVSSPMFTLFSVISLASGVAVTTAVYSVVDTQFLRDLGVPQPDRAAFIVASYGGRPQYGALSAPDFEDLRRAQRSFSSLSATAPIMPSVASTTTAEIVSAEAVDGIYFTTLGITAAIGRTIHAQDDASAARVAVLSDDFWRGRFAGDPQVIGRTIRVNGQTFEIVGVAPPRYGGLYGPLRRTRLWIPLNAEASLGTFKALAGRTAREHRRLLVVGRLANGVTATQASAELLTLAARFDRDFPPRSVIRAGRTDRDWSATTIDAMHRDENNSLRRFGMTIVALVALVLLVACTNLANLVLARGTARQGELAVRMAMGASRGRLIWEQCIESLLLAIAGAAASYVMFQVVSAMMTMDFTLGQNSGHHHRHSAGAQRTGGGDRGRVVAAGLARVRPGTGDSAGADGRHPQRAGGRRHRHPAESRPSAHGDSLAGGDCGGIFHPRDHVHPRHPEPGRARQRYRPRSHRGGDAEFRQRGVE